MTFKPIAQLVGLLVQLITFPGVVVYEFVRNKLAINLKSKDYKKPINLATRILFPFIINTTLAVLCFYFYFKWDSLILLWLSVSFAMHAFPKAEDPKELSKFGNKLKNKALSISVMIIADVFLVINFLRILWIDLIYAIGLGYLVRYFVITA